MKPGSSHRCKARHDGLRCRKHADHDGKHKAPRGDMTVTWTDEAVGTYTCAGCGGTFPKGWSDEEAAAERERDFPTLADAESVVVCDDCYKRMRSAFADGDIAWEEPVHA